MYDVAIIGGGPAGATLARLIGKKYKVLLLERRVFEEPLYCGFQKCCGGLLDPDAQKMLATFHLGLPKSVIVSPQMFSVRTMDLDNGLERYYQRHYVNIDREAFDKWIESLIPPEVSVINGCVYREYESSGDCLNIVYTKDGKTFEEKTRILVGADGAFSKVRGQAFGDKLFPRKYVALQEWFEGDLDINYYMALFDSSITDFYSWVIPKEKYLIVGSALDPKNGPALRFQTLKEKLRSRGFSLRQSMRKNGTMIFRPLHMNQIQTGRDNILLIGEAAGFISPSSAEGFSYAFRSAQALELALSSGLESAHRRYNKNVEKLRTNIFLKNMKSPGMYNRYIRLLAMKSGLGAIRMSPKHP